MALACNDLYKIHYEFNGYFLTPVKKEDSAAYKALILEVLSDYGMGYDQNPWDKDLENLESHYPFPKCRFYILRDSKGTMVGGGGFKKISGNGYAISTCEIAKMYFLPEVRGKGLGRWLMKVLISEAKQLGYQQIILETNSELIEARMLYKKLGFTERDNPHSQCNCDLEYTLSLQ